MTEWMAACSSGNLEAVISHRCFRKPHSIRYGLEAVIRGGDHVSVMRLLLVSSSNMSLEVIRSLLDLAIQLGRTRIVCSVLLPWVDQYSKRSGDHKATLSFIYMQTCRAAHLGHADILNQLMDSRLRRACPTNIMRDAVWRNQPATFACVIHHRDRIASIHPHSPWATAINWRYVLYVAPCVEMILCVETCAIADKVPIRLIDWIDAFNWAAERIDVCPDKRPCIRLYAERIQQMRNDDKNDTLIPMLLDQLLCPGLENPNPGLHYPFGTISTESQWFDRFALAHDLCVILELDMWPTYLLIQCIDRWPSTVLTLAFHGGWLTHTHLIGCKPDDWVFDIWNAHQATQSARRIELDLVTDLPRVLGNLVLQY
jgi:hypothetical protein